MFVVAGAGGGRMGTGGGNEDGVRNFVFLCLAFSCGIPLVVFVILAIVIGTSTGLIWAIVVTSVCTLLALFQSRHKIAKCFSSCCSCCSCCGGDAARKRGWLRPAAPTHHTPHPGATGARGRRAARSNTTTTIPTHHIINISNDLHESLLSAASRQASEVDEDEASSTSTSTRAVAVQPPVPWQSYTPLPEGTAVSAPECPKDYECAVCLDVWNDPIELVPCGHIYCKKCVSTLKTCPQCRGDIRSHKFPKPALQIEAAKVEVECDDCGWKGSKGQAVLHLKDCAAKIL